jgi:hypothetical protein
MMTQTEFGEALDRAGYGKRWRKGICLKPLADDGESV